MNRLIDKAQEHLRLIEAGKGQFADDEPFVVPSGFGVYNKLNAQDVDTWLDKPGRFLTAGTL